MAVTDNHLETESELVEEEALANEGTKKDDGTSPGSPPEKPEAQDPTMEGFDQDFGDGFDKEKLFEKTRNLRSPREILRKCLIYLLADRQDARTMCFDLCAEVHRDLAENTSIHDIAIKTIHYLEVCGTTNKLWQWIRERNQKNYDIWFPEWQKAIEKETAEKFRTRGEEGSTDEKLIGHVVRRVDTGQSETIGERALASACHNTISSWFFNELDPSERSMVLTTALFEGVNRHYLAELSDSVERICFGQLEQEIVDG